MLLIGLLTWAVVVGTSFVGVGVGVGRWVGG